MTQGPVALRTKDNKRSWEYSKIFITGASTNPLHSRKYFETVLNDLARIPSWESAKLSCLIYGLQIPGSGLLDQVSESIIQFPQVKPLAGLDWTDMESWWLTPFRTEIFCNPKGVCHCRLWPWFCNNNLSIGPNRNSVCSFWNGFKWAWSLQS